MHSSKSFRLTYYLFLNIISFLICTALVGLLSWPILAEISIAVSIYVLLVTFGKYLFESRLIQTDHDLATQFRNLIFQLKQLGNAEKG